MQSLNKYSLNNVGLVMNKLIYSLVIVAGLVLTGCDHTTCPTCSDDWDNAKINGSGNITSIVYDVPVFNSIVHNTVGDVNVTYDSEQSLVVLCDDNIQEFVKLKVKNGSLYISLESDLSLSSFSLTIEVGITAIKSFSANSAGSIYGQNSFAADKLFLSTNSAGNINMDVQVEDLYTTINSAGNVFVKGQAINHFVSVNSAGNLRAFRLNTDTTYIVVSSAGSAEVNVSKYLDATISSIGSVYYIGYPAIVQVISSLGRLVNSN